MHCCSRFNFIYLGQAKSKISSKMWRHLLWSLKQFNMLRVKTHHCYLPCHTAVHTGWHHNSKCPPRDPHTTCRVKHRHGMKLATNAMEQNLKTVHLSHIPQCTIQNRNVHISVLNGALWDRDRCIVGIVLFHRNFFPSSEQLKHNVN